MPRRTTLLFLLLVTSCWLLGQDRTEQPQARSIDIGSRREPFLDHFLIDRLQGTRLKLQEPKPAGVAIKLDRPWEGIFSGYFTVLKDGNMYRMYYRGFPGESQGESRGINDGAGKEFTCYAESTDGIHWTKPNLGLFEVMGTRQNNVILANDPPYSTNFSPFLDMNPGAKVDERYKAVAGMGDNMVCFRIEGLPIEKSGLFGFISSDGIHWKKIRNERIFTDGSRVFDSQNVALWSESENCYVLYYRQHVDMKTNAIVRNEKTFLKYHAKTVARATSKDFLHWSEPVLMRYSDHPPNDREHLYTNQTHPYFRAPHIYISLAMRWMQDQGPLTSEQISPIIKELERAGLRSNYSKSGKDWHAADCSDTVLMTSRGGDLYDQTFLEGFVKPGHGLNNWTSRSNMAALRVVQTSSNEMSLYIHRRYGQVSSFLERLTLRIDGFTSVNAPYHGGEMVTKPLQFVGKELEINYATGAAGSVRVEIQHANGTPVPGFGLADCPGITGDEIERVVSWKGGSDVGHLAKQGIRLRFILKDADLFSLRFR